jgi:hypothetical protein
MNCCPFRYWYTCCPLKLRPYISFCCWTCSGYPTSSSVVNVVSLCLFLFKLVNLVLEVLYLNDSSLSKLSHSYIQYHVTLTNNPQILVDICIFLYIFANSLSSGSRAIFIIIYHVLLSRFMSWYCTRLLHLALSLIWWFPLANGAFLLRLQ